MLKVVRHIALSALVFQLVLAASTAQSQRQSKDAKPPQAAKESGAESSPKFDVLSHEEAAGWAKVLSKFFSTFRITAEETAKPIAQPVTSSAHKPTTLAGNNQKPKETSPTGRLCLTNGEDAPSSPCPTVPPGLIKEEEFSSLKTIIRVLDSNNFKDVMPDSSYIIQTNLKKEPLEQVRQFWKAIEEFFARPAQDLKLDRPDTRFFVLVPRIGTKTSQTLTAALIKQDLKSVEETYERSLSLKIPSNDGGCASAPTSVTCRKAIVEMERWVSRNTVPLSYLSPRDVALALSELQSSIEVRAQASAITILPNPDPNANGAYLAADAIEREILYAKAKSESKTPKAGKDDSGSKPEAPPLVITTKSITSTSKMNDGKPMPPETITEVDTATSTQSKAAAPGDTGSDASKKSQAGTDSSQGGENGGTASAKSGNTAQSAGEAKGDKGANALTLSSDDPIEFDNVVRLFHLRRAKDIAAAINQAAPKDNPLVATLANNPQDDLVMILPAVGKHAMDIKRAIAILDQPRPQLSLQVWHYLLSTKNGKSEKPIWGIFTGSRDDQRLQTSYAEFRDAVVEANKRMTAALERGYAAAVDYAANQTNNGEPYSHIFRSAFAYYLTGKYQECIEGNRYCLGYYDALDVTKGERTEENRVAGASLSRLVLLVAASKDWDDGATPLVNAITNEMDEGPDCYVVHEHSICLEFPAFADRLKTLSEPRNLHALQAAILDFLFQYKWTVAYPNDFVPYDLQRTAHTLDDLLQPLIEAFNHDLDSYIEKVFQAEAKTPDLNGLVNRGQIQVATLSGSAASVQGQVKNYFDITPPMSLNDILNGSNESNLATALKGVLEPKEILVLQALANVGNQPRITAELSENASLKITPVSLDTASSAELDVDFDVGEPTAPVTSGVSSPPKDLLDRVADHHVTTHVRVESVKLFQLSSFTMTLTHPQRGTLIPVIGWGWEAIFGTTPYVGNLFRLPPYSETVDNRSLAVVRAVVVPTAMDIGLGLRFEGDRVLDPIAGTTTLVSSVEDAGGKLRPFHKKMMQCIMQGGDCADVTLSSTAEDLRLPRSH